VPQQQMVVLTTEPTEPYNPEAIPIAYPQGHKPMCIHRLQ